MSLVAFNRRRFRGMCRYPPVGQGASLSIDFPSAFRALTNGKDPFRWQERLFNEFARGNILDACDIPTGLGKTSVMAIWLAALDLVSPDARLPRRLVYVVDRRTVVDQATEEAEQLAKALGDGAGKSIDPVIAMLRKRLRLEPGRALPISTLRGQLADNRAWLDDPSAPAIVVGTVDMIGSRLLFQGYNVSARMRRQRAYTPGSGPRSGWTSGGLRYPSCHGIRPVESGQIIWSASTRP